MVKKYLSATEVKENISEVLSNVYFKGKTAIVKRYGKPIAKIVPIGGSSNVKEIEEKLSGFFGVDSKFPKVKKDRNFRGRTVNL